MLLTYILIIVSFLLGCLALKYLRYYDAYDPEPIFNLVTATLLGGIISILVTILLNYLLTSYLGLFSKNIQIILAGVVEEPSKLIAFLVVFKLYRKYFVEGVDYFIYMFCVAIGFSLIENFLYAQINFSAILFRFLISTPGHLFFSSFMALSIMQFIHGKARPIHLLFALLVSIAAHGIHNLLSIIGLNSYIVLLMGLFYAWALRELIVYAHQFSSAKTNLFKFIQAFNPKEERGLTCLNCNDKKHKLTFKTAHFNFQKCNTCCYYVCTSTELLKIFNFFSGFSTDQSIKKIWNFLNYRPVYRAQHGSLYLEEKPHELATIIEGTKTYVLGAGNVLDPTKNLAYFDAKNTSHEIHKISLKYFIEMKSHFIIRFLSSQEARENKKMMISSSESEMIQRIEDFIDELKVESDLGNYNFSRMLILQKRNKNIKKLNLKRYFKNLDQDKMNQIYEELKEADLVK